MPAGADAKGEVALTVFSAFVAHYRLEVRFCKARIRATRRAAWRTRSGFAAQSHGTAHARGIVWQLGRLLLERCDGSPGTRIAGLPGRARGQVFDEERAALMPCRPRRSASSL